ncbi:MAG: nucleotidyl transferase AbiEii/AbiGii toxin family protein [Leptospiraceae bacterium]|nr:nucleotidyl transferase AbiEii/AbiGii toxin family protein [Leptospiraceae bacterium]
MKSNFPEKVTTESLFIWIIHRMVEEFKDHAILKGGMALNLVDCPRSTNDLDYVMIPYKSKKEVVDKINKILLDIPNAKIDQQLNSKAYIATISCEGVNIQVESSVAMECKSIPISTDSLAKKSNQLGKIIRVMSFDVALANKLAAWNERRLLRDLYDVYFLTQMLGEKPDMDVLLKRLSKIESRIPKLKSKKKMSLTEFIDELRSELITITMDRVNDEIAPLLDKNAIEGLDIKIKHSINHLINTI